MAARTIVVLNFGWMHYNAVFSRAMTCLAVLFPLKNVLTHFTTCHKTDLIWLVQLLLSLLEHLVFELVTGGQCISEDPVALIFLKL